MTGEPPFSARHVGQIARFKTGDRFKQSDVDDLRRALVATGLVSTVEVKVTPVGAGQTVDLDVRLEPAPMRTVAGELGYGTGEGARAEASWQHRNFFNPEGALTVRGVVGTQEQVAAVSFRRNNFRRRDQVLNAQVSASNVDRDAYAAKTLLLSGGIERQSNFIWHKKWTWSLGGELSLSDERDTIESTGEERRRKFFIAALPASLGYDGSDDLLDPTKGFRLLGRISPEVSWQSGAFGYGRAQFDASAYHPVSDKVVAAGRVRVGTIVGASRDMIAPSRRFYAGGGGSVRGYGYQQLGPRDADNDPIGGRSLAEFGLEARIRVGGAFGIVPFFDGGTLSTKRDAEYEGLAVRRGHRRALLFLLRADPDRRRHAAQSAKGRQPRGGDRVARPGVLMAIEASAVELEARAAPAPVRLRRNWARRLLDELLALIAALLLLAGDRAGAARHRAGASLHRRPHRPVRDRVGPPHPHRPDRRVGVRPVAAEECAGRRPPRRVPDLARNHCSTGRRAHGCTIRCISTGSKRGG